MKRRGIEIHYVFLHDPIFKALKKIAESENRSIGNMTETLLKKCLKENGYKL